MTRQHPRANRRTPRKCDNPCCDRVAEGPNALGVTEGEAETIWHLCGPQCLKTWITLALLKIEHYERRMTAEAEA